MSLKKLKEEILPSVFNKSGCLLLDCEFDSGSVGQDQFMSNVVFLSAIVKSGSDTLKIPLVVKFEPFSPKLREFLKTTVQFQNEVIVYKNVLPFLNKNRLWEDIFPKFYYGVGEMSGPDNVVIIEDLKPAGFQLTEDRVFISYDHLSLAMSKLGKFHALSFAAKKDSHEQFHQVVNNLKETTWEDWHTYLPVVKACFHRPAEYLIKQGKHVKLLQKLLSSFDRNIVEFMKKILTPNEPLAVICHGDFCRNNILFKYDQGSATPTDVRFFDVATSRYSSPAIDISFLFFLNSSKKTRLDHWDDLLASYHHALSSTVPGLVVPSLEDIREEVRRKALYGFVISSFFLPMMLFESPYHDMELVANTPQEELAPKFALIGGEDCTKMLSDMLEELIERKCLSMDHKFLV